MTLLKWQFISLISKSIAVGIGIAQGIIIIRILSPADYGLVGIVAAVGSVVGVYQHLGLASGTTREISAVKTKEAAFKVFLSGVLARFSISIPLALGLFILSPHIANNIYHQSSILGPLRIYSGILLLQAGQDVCNSVLAGLQRFKRLFIYQAVIAVISFSLYVPLVFYFKFWGYFYAMFGLTFISATALWFLALKSFEGSFVKPKFNEVKNILKDVFSVGLSVYAAKIAFTFWQRIGPLFLGTRISAAEVGFFNFAAFYSNKILTVSDALTDVNLPVMTKKITENISNFRSEFVKNYEKVYSFMLFSALSGIYWAPELIHTLIGTKYDPAIYLIPILVFAFWVYGLINFLGASIIVPAKLLKHLIFYYAILITGTISTYYLFGFRAYDLLKVTAAAMAVGSLFSIIYLGYISYRKVSILLFDKKILVVSIIQLPLLVFYFFAFPFAIKIILYIINSFLIFGVLDKFSIVNPSGLKKAIWKNL